MEIISHRGFWLKEEEKNTMHSFERSLSENYGIETDVRDYDGNLIISHDVPREACDSFEDFLKLYNNQTSKATLAINIKSDGLQDLINALLEKHNIKNYFVFDMSVPDHYIYIKKGIISFTRHSEIELHPNLYKESEGVWMDQFISDWISSASIIKHMDAGKKVCIVSPELHGRDKTNAWSRYKKLPKAYLDKMQICTDYPSEADSFFND